MTHQARGAATQWSFTRHPNPRQNEAPIWNKT